ncbi:putative bacterial regulatory protein LysR Family protein [Marinomonas sp. MED121]|uniref:LysR family transcriptional regulator n=1 Tax=Marinomonas sp. MED121 TaxID=314277 RepID=UPI000068FA7B|nr:LysR family transcriptional regulator [Marinomonas sp. MED121]EAQ63923.1 putative bacterial regulatory protein LysR Family protein [Marinomonas sp. MED121]
MIENLELHHLKTLDALYRNRTLSLAAESLNVSQQAVSAKLKRLRDILGDRLFVREGHGIVPTPYALTIQPFVEKIIQQLNTFPLPQDNDIAQSERTLVISATDYGQEIIIKSLVSKLEAAAPNVKLIVCNIEVASLTKKMSQGEINLAFTTSGYVPDGLISEPLFQEKYLCVESSQAAVADLSAPLSLQALIKREFVIVNPGAPSLIGSADSWFEQQGFKRQVYISVPSFYMAKTYLASSTKVGFIPARLLLNAKPLRQSEQGQSLRKIALEKYPPGFEVVAVYHASAKQDPLIRWVIEAVKQLAL